MYVARLPAKVAMRVVTQVLYSCRFSHSRMLDSYDIIYTFIVTSHSCAITRQGIRVANTFNIRWQVAHEPVSRLVE